MNDSKIIRGLAYIASWFLTMGWAIYGLWERDFILMFVVLSVMFGTMIQIALKETKK